MVVRANSKKMMTFLVLGSLILFLSFVPWLTDAVNQGQMIKQTSTLQIIEGYTRRPLVNGFPTRIYNEIFHQQRFAWIEEFPLYHGAAVLIHKISPFSEAIAARVVSLLCYLSLFLSLFFIGRHWWPGKNRNIALLMITFLSFPIFRIYGVSIMPEIMMLQFCSWALYFAFKQRLTPTLVLLTLACLSKYYALFFAASLYLYWSWRELKSLQIKGFLSARRLTIVGLPLTAVLVFLFIVFQLEIHNPIQDYAQVGMAHSFSWSSLFSAKFFSRSFTWVFLKNPNTLNGLASLILLGFAMRKKQLGMVFLFFLLPQLLFAALFAKTFIIHDYYAIQLSFLMALLLGRHLAQISEKKRVPVVLFLILSVALSFYRHHRMTRPSEFIALTSSQLKRFKTEGPGLVISDRAPETILHMAQKAGWRLKTDGPYKYPLLGQEFRARLSEERFNWILVAGFENIESRWTQLVADFPPLKQFVSEGQFKGQNFSIRFFRKASP